jgi:hypothetical protein
VSEIRVVKLGPVVRFPGLLTTYPHLGEIRGHHTYRLDKNPVTKTGDYMSLTLYVSTEGSTARRPLISAPYLAYFEGTILCEAAGSAESSTRRNPRWLVPVLGSPLPRPPTM